MLKVAMIGFGGIAQIHRYAYWYHNRQGVPIRLVAACDKDPKKFEEATTINFSVGTIEDELPFTQYSEWEEMLDKEKPDLVDICLPTKFHEAITVAVLERGYAVLCEKPMAPDYEACGRMLAAAERSGKPLMIGQCVRFYSAYEYLKQLIDEQPYGKVLEAEFCRYSPLPAWSANAWQQDNKQSGGCLTELNIHDVDVVRWLFGDPYSTSCVLETRKTPEDVVKVRYRYPFGDVAINGGWLDDDEAFTYGYRVRFEGAEIFMKDNAMTLTIDGVSQPVEWEDGEGIMGEIAYFAKVLSGECENTKNPAVASAQTIKMLEWLHESAANNGREMPVCFAD